MSSGEGSKRDENKTLHRNIANQAQSSSDLTSERKLSVREARPTNANEGSIIPGHGTHPD